MTEVTARSVALDLIEARKNGNAGSTLWLQCHVSDHLSDALTWEMVLREMRAIEAERKAP